ncbi:MAG: TetR/AcrR family transcriptional regulator [Actinobacteria bacterium]|nr:TetR/AcrR family transcriptional regulator [Actinomycetota bacterium]
MTERPYHHGHLRDALLAEAERTLREQGAEQLSLRDLARQAGVSHAAPRRHFADRQALLDALAGAGFARLADEVAAAVTAAGPDFRARLRATGVAYVRFATTDPALMELMFAAKIAGGDEELAAGAGRLFITVGELISEGQRTGQLPAGDPERLRLLFMATARGIAGIVTPGQPGAGQADGLIDDVVALFTAGGR